MIIAIDFDGTCVMHDYPKVGEDIGAVPVLKELVNAGHQLILWTMRCDSGVKSGQFESGLTDAIDWFKQNNIPLYGIQRNPDQDSWTKSPKAYAQLYIDDAALGAPLTTINCPNFIKNYDLCKKDCELCQGKSHIGRPFLNWKKAKEILKITGVLPQ